mmetsp:Transcript_28672/g.51543  ORF Transcript_28672/g.51543 Transcript_28672/m.51543 type:complete len:90 (-) Transcript_28672:93-362(-)
MMLIIIIMTRDITNNCGSERTNNDAITSSLHIIEVVRGGVAVTTSSLPIHKMMHDSFYIIEPLQTTAQILQQKSLLQRKTQLLIVELGW